MAFKEICFNHFITNGFLWVKWSVKDDGITVDKWDYPWWKDACYEWAREKVIEKGFRFSN